MQRERSDLGQHAIIPGVEEPFEGGETLLDLG
jgi:hypothetical protein